MTKQQLELFPGHESVPLRVLLEEEHFGKWDARCGLPIRSNYTKDLSGERLNAYERGYRREVARRIAEDAKDIVKYGEMIPCPK